MCNDIYEIKRNVYDIRTNKHSSYQLDTVYTSIRDHTMFVYSLLCKPPSFDTYVLPW